MKKCSISSLLSIIVTLISIFICFTTMFTNIYNNTDFNFWYFPGAIIFVISIIINIIAMFKGNKTLNIILFLLTFCLTYLYHTICNRLNVIFNCKIVRHDSYHTFGHRNFLLITDFENTSILLRFHYLSGQASLNSEALAYFRVYSFIHFHLKFLESNNYIRRS